MSDEKRLAGTVVFFAPAKQFGFARPDGDETDIFLHFSQWKGAAPYPETGDRVSFIAEPDPRRSGRRRARDILLIERKE